MRNYFTKTSQMIADISRRKAAGIAGVALVLMAVVAPLAQFGVLENLVSEDASATVGNIVASPGIVRLAGVAFVVVAFLDLVVAWTLHVVFREVNRVGSLVTAWLRTVYGAVLVIATTNLFGVAKLASDRASRNSGELEAQVMSALNSFHTGYELIGLTIFSLHLIGLGYLVSRSADFPRFLGVLVVMAGAGYMFDSVGQILFANFSATVAQFTFVGEALLIFWLFMRCAKGFSSRISVAGSNPNLPEPAAVIR